MLPARTPPPFLPVLQSAYNTLISYCSIEPAVLAIRSQITPIIRNNTMPAIIFRTAVGFPSLANQKATAKNIATGAIYAVNPKIPNKTPLIALPTGPIIPKLQQNNITIATNRTISPISWNSSLSCAVLCVCLLRLPVVLFLVLLEDDVPLPDEDAMSSYP